MSALGKRAFPPILLALAGACGRADPPPATPAATKPTLEDRAAIETWLKCGTGVATASVVACEMVSEFYQGNPLPAPEASPSILFGSCYAVAEGVGDSKTTYAVATNSPEGFKMKTLSGFEYEQQRLFEVVTTGIDARGDMTKLRTEIGQVVAFAGRPDAAMPAEGRVFEDRLVLLDLQSDPQRIRACRLARIDHFAAAPSTRE